MQHTYHKMTDSGVNWLGKIPSDWELKRAKFVYTSKKELNTGLIEAQRLALTLKGVIEREDGDSIGLSPKSLDSYQIFEEGDLVFKLIDLENKQTSRVGLVHRRGIMSPAYIRLAPLSELIPKYYYYYFYSLYLTYVYNNIAGEGVRANINSNELLEIKVLAPSKSTQQKIADFLDSELAKIDTLISKQKKLLELLEEKRQATISLAVTRGINPNIELKETNIPWLGEIPYKWEISKLGYRGKLQNGINIGAEFFGIGYPFVSYGTVYHNYELPGNVDELVMSSEEDRIVYSVKSGDIFFTRTSETIEEIGFSSVCLSSIKDAVFAGFLIRFRPNTNSSLNPRYAKYYFRNNKLRAYFVKEMNIVTRASLSQGLLRNMPVLIPPLSVQTEIAEYLDNKEINFRQIKEMILKQIELLKERRISLISNAVTGKIKV